MHGRPSFGRRDVAALPRLGGKPVGNGQRTANAAAGAGICLDEVDVPQTLVFDFFQDGDDVMDAVDSQVLVGIQGNRLAAGIAPANTGVAGQQACRIRVDRCVVEFLQFGQDQRIGVGNGDDTIDMRCGPGRSD